MPAKAQDAKPTNEAAHQHAISNPAIESAALTPQIDMLTVQRSLNDLAAASPVDILTLQRAVGNRAVTQLLQAKLTIGAPDDCYEHEADRVAEQVVNGQWSVDHHQPAATRPVQRQEEEEEEEVQTKPLAAFITPLPSAALRAGVQRQEAPEEEELQTKLLVQRQQVPEEEEIQTQPVVQREAAPEEEEFQTKPLPSTALRASIQRHGDGSFEAGGDLEQRLTASRGSGSPLPAETREFMEARFGSDFGDVRVHTGGEAVQMNRELSAQAFTHGQDIYMSEGKYDPGADAGKRLLAHELTHVAQQMGSRQPQPEAHASGQVQSEHASPAIATQRTWAAESINLTATEGKRIQRGIGEWYKKTTHKLFGWYKDWAREEQRKEQEERFRHGKKGDGWADWMIDLVIAIRKENLAGAAQMNALWDQYLETLQEHSFKYFTSGGDMWTDSPNGSCVQLSSVLAVLAQELGLAANAEYIRRDFFVTREGTRLVDGTACKGNLKMGSQYIEGRYVFSDHVAVKFEGRFYDPLTMTTYASADDPVAWGLAKDGEDRLRIVAVNDGATWPTSSEAITSANAYLALTEDPPGNGFQGGWVLSRL